MVHSAVISYDILIYKELFENIVMSEKTVECKNAADLVKHASICTTILSLDTR